MRNTNPLIIILNILIILIGLYLGFLFIKSKSFNTYACYNMIIFSFILFLDNILRIIPLESNNDYNCNIAENIVAGFIVFFDKLILATLATQGLIYYFGVIKTTLYSKNEKKIFYITLVINITLCAFLAILYIPIYGTQTFGVYCYPNDKHGRKVLDDIFNVIYFSVSLFSNVISFMYIRRKKKEVESGLIEEMNFNHNYKRILFMFIINTWTFILSFLIIYDTITGDASDILYLTTCLVIDLFNSINGIVFKETLKIFCKAKYNQIYNPIKSRRTFGGEEDEEEN